MKVARHKLLTREEEAALIRRYQAGDRKAGEEVIRCNQLFAAQRAYKWAAYGVPVEDLFQEANIGMLRALRTFDTERGLRFITYAAGWVDAFIGRRLMTDTTVVRRATSRAKRTSFYRDLADHRSSECSLDAPLDETQTLHAFTADEGPSAEAQLAEVERDHGIRTAVRLLPERERFVIENRLLSSRPMLLKELGEHFGLTREGARQIEVRALKRLRRHLAALEAA